MSPIPSLIRSVPTALRYALPLLAGGLIACGAALGWGTDPLYPTERRSAPASDQESAGGPDVAWDVWVYKRQNKEHGLQVHAT